VEFSNEYRSGKIHGLLGICGKEGYRHYMSNYDLNNTHKRLGTKPPRVYESLREKRASSLSKHMQTIPEAPTADEVEKDPSLAVYTYLRQECLRCHTGAKGEAEEATIEEWGVLVVTFHTQMRGSMRETIAQFQRIRGDIF